MYLLPFTVSGVVSQSNPFPFGEVFVVLLGLDAVHYNSFLHLGVPTLTVVTEFNL